MSELKYINDPGSSSSGTAPVIGSPYNLNNDEEYMESIESPIMKEFFNILKKVSSVEQGQHDQENLKT